MNDSVFKKVLSVRIKGKGRIKAKDVFAPSSHAALLGSGLMEVVTVIAMKILVRCNNLL